MSSTHDKLVDRLIAEGTIRAYENGAISLSDAEEQASFFIDGYTSYSWSFEVTRAVADDAVKILEGIAARRRRDLKNKKNSRKGL